MKKNLNFSLVKFINQILISLRYIKQLIKNHDITNDDKTIILSKASESARKYLESKNLKIPFRVYINPGKGSKFFILGGLEASLIHGEKEIIIAIFSHLIFPDYIDDIVLTILHEYSHAIFDDLIYIKISNHCSYNLYYTIGTIIPKFFPTIQENFAEWFAWYLMDKLDNLNADTNKRCKYLISCYNNLQ